MIKSQILEKLNIKHENLDSEDIEVLFNIFIKKIINYILKLEKYYIKK